MQKFARRPELDLSATMPATTKLKLLHKGLIMVLLPCIINSALILVLEGSLDRARDLMEQSRNQSIIVNTLTQDTLVVTGILNAGNNMIINGSPGSLAKLIKGYFEKLQYDLDCLGPKMPDRAAYESKHSEITKLVEWQRRLIVNLDKRSYASEPLVVKLRQTKPWLKLCSQLSANINDTLTTAQNDFARIVDMQHKEQITTGLIIAATLVFNALLAILLAMIFQQDIAKRIYQVVRNSKKITTNQPLDESVPGNDEINTLYADLLSASRDLRNHEEFRQSVMQMMAHDLRSPLTASTVLMDVLEQSPVVTAQPASAARLAAIKERIRYCLNLINDLLLLESLESGTIKPDCTTESVQDVLEVALSNVQPAIDKKHILMQDQLSPQEASLNFERAESAFTRLLTHAINQMHDGDVLSVRVVPNPDEAVVHISWDGGLDDDDIFDKYYYVDKAVNLDKDALSLPVASKLIQLQGGAVRCTTVKNKTTFIVSFALTQKNRRVRS